MAQHERLWTVPEVADYLAVTRATVYRLAAREPDWPQPIYLSARAVRYRPDQVREWADRRQTRPASAGRPAARPAPTI